jgi:hypothetical protein
MKPISTGNRARSIGTPSSATNDEELPDDIDNEKYIAIPDKRELDLGKPLVLDFARSGGEPNSAESQRRGSLLSLSSTSFKPTAQPIVSPRCSFLALGNRASGKADERLPCPR